MEAIWGHRCARERERWGGQFIIIMILIWSQNPISHFYQIKMAKLEHLGKLGSVFKVQGTGDSLSQSERLSHLTYAIC